MESRTKEMSYKVSVIVPVYNAEEYILETLESVRRQSLGFENIQLILVDDCSTDSSYRTMYEWSSSFSNVALEKTKRNSGSPALPRNMGLNLAKAPYVMFLDNDDMYTDNACEILLDTLLKTQADIVSGDSELMASDEKFTKEEKKRLLWHTEEIPEGEHVLEDELGDWIVPFLNNHWCKIYKKELIDKYHIRSLEGEIWEDLLFLYLYLAVSSKCVYIKQPIVRYRARRKSLSHVHDADFYYSIPRSMDFGKKCADDLGVSAKYLSLVNYGFGETEYYIDEMLGNTSLSETELSRCIKEWRGPLVYSTEDGYSFHSPYCKILSDDMKRGDVDQAAFHFMVLKELYLQRKEEIDNITNSKTFKLAQMLSKLIHH